MNYEILYSCISHKGKVRSINQDNFICDNSYMGINDSSMRYPISGTFALTSPKLFGVFDGMGGEECGEIASFIAAKEAAKIQFKKNGVLSLNEYCKHANDEICQYAKEHSVCSMGTTAAMLLCAKNEIMLCNIGDSKIFRFANEKLEQISKDHVAVSAYGVKPPLLQNLGIPPEQSIIEPYFSQGGYCDGDRFLICSDGLTDMVSLDEIERLLGRYHIEKATARLANRALKNGGKDNVTVILIEIKQIKNSMLKVFKR